MLRNAKYTEAPRAENQLSPIFTYDKIGRREIDAEAISFGSVYGDGLSRTLDAIQGSPKKADLDVPK